MWYDYLMKNSGKILCGVCIFKEGKTYVSYSPQLDLASCGRTARLARKNFVDAFAGFVETAAEQGTLEKILQEAGYTKKKDGWVIPSSMSAEVLTLPISLSR